jgi:hypothetical protein
MVRRLGWIRERRVRTCGVDDSSTPADDSGRPVGRCRHLNSCCKSADLKMAADRYVVTRSNVSIDAHGLVGVSVEPVVISVVALP